MAAISRRIVASRSRRKGVAASGQMIAAIGQGEAAALRLSNFQKLLSAAPGSHFIVWGIDGWTMRSQIFPAAVGDVSSRTAPATPGRSTKSAAPITGIQRRRSEIGTRDDAPRSAGNEAASTVTKLNP